MASTISKVTLHPKFCGCGNIATCSVSIMVDGMSRGRKNYCDVCASSEPWQSERPKPLKPGRPMHRDYGRSNSDQSSLTQGSIRRWGEKIKARQKAKKAGA